VTDKAGTKGITTLVSINPESIPKSQFSIYRQRFDEFGLPKEFSL
jgi:hypothetical protein